MTPYRARVAAGLCVKCPASAAPGRTLCEPHLERARVVNLARYHERGQRVTPLWVLALRDRGQRFVQGRDGVWRRAGLRRVR